MALMAASQISKKRWYFDSGASRHMTGVQNLLHNYREIEESKVAFGGGEPGVIKGKGKLTSSEAPGLDNVYYVEGLRANLISVSQLCDEGLTVTFKGTKCSCTDELNNTILSGTRCANNCFMWEQTENECFKAETDETALWHQKLRTAEAEYIAMGSCCTQLLWMKQMASDYGMDNGTFMIKCDNKSAIDISKNPVQHSRTKHIDIRHHFIRELVEDKTMCLEHVSSEQQLADIFTKPLDYNTFVHLRKSLGVCEL